MHPHAPRIIAALALLICLVCPLVETFDNWDHTVQTGNDTEYAVVVMALCVGVAYSLARFILKLSPLDRFAKSVLSFAAKKVPFFAHDFAFLPSNAASPPPLPLRI
jgi:hypothetical protein